MVQKIIKMILYRKAETQFRSRLFYFKSDFLPLKAHYTKAQHDKNE